MIYYFFVVDFSKIKNHISASMQIKYSMISKILLKKSLLPNWGFKIIFWLLFFLWIWLCGPPMILSIICNIFQMSRAKSYFYKCVFNDMAHALILRKDVDEDWLGVTWQKCKWKMRRKNCIHYSPCGFWYGKLCQKGNGSDSSTVHKYANNLIDSSKTEEVCM